MLKKINRLGLFFIGLFVSLNSVLAASGTKSNAWKKIFEKTSDSLIALIHSDKVVFLFYFIVILMGLQFIFSVLLKKVFSNHSAFKDSVDKSSKIAWLISIPSTVAFFYPYNAVKQFIHLLNFFLLGFLTLVVSSILIYFAVKFYEKRKSGDDYQKNVGIVVLVSMLLVFLLINATFLQFCIGWVGGAQMNKEPTNFFSLSGGTSAHGSTRFVYVPDYDKDPVGSGTFADIRLSVASIVSHAYFIFVVVLFCIFVWKIVALLGKSKLALKDEEEIAEFEELKQLINQINNSVKRIDSYLKWIKTFLNQKIKRNK